MICELAAALLGRDSTALTQSISAGREPAIAEALAGLADEFARRGGVPVGLGDPLLRAWPTLPRVRDVLLREYFACGVWVYGHARVPAMQIVLGDVVLLGLVRLGDALMRLTRCGRTPQEEDLA